MEAKNTKLSVNIASRECVEIFNIKKKKRRSCKHKTTNNIVSLLCTCDASQFKKIL